MNQDVAAGRVFSLDLEVQVAAGQKAYFLFTVGANKRMILTSRSFDCSAGPSYYKVYSGFSAVTPGASQLINKMKPDHEDNTICTVQSCTAPVTLGNRVTLVPNYGIGQGSNASGDLKADDAERNLPSNTQFLLEFTSPSNQEAFHFLNLVWTEEPEIFRSFK